MFILNIYAIELKGSALFSNGKMVGVVNQRQNGLLMAMMNKLKKTQ